VAIVPWEEYFVIPYVVSMAKVMGLLALVLGIAKMAFSGRLRVPPLPMLFFALFVGWCLLAVNWSIDPEKTFLRTTTYVLLFTFVWLTWELADTPGHQKSIMRGYVIGTAFLVFNVYLNQIGMGLQEASITRATAEDANPNGVAAACIGACQFALFLITRREKGRFEFPNWVYWGFIAAAGIVIPMTGSRTGFVAAIPAVASFYPVLLKATKKSGLKNAMMLIIIIAGIGVAVPQLVSMALLRRVTEGIQADTFQKRVGAWQRGLHEWSKTPFLGVGPGTYSVAGLAPGEREMAAHNSFVSVLVETGVVGASLYFVFWVLVIRRILRMPKDDRFFWLVFLASLLPIMITGSNETNKYCWMVGALVLCQAANAKPVRVPNQRSSFRLIRTLGPATPPLGPPAS